MIAASNFSGALVTLGIITLLQSVGISAKFDMKTDSDQQLLDSSKCSFGPAYWCESMSNAVHCKAVEHCIRTTWRIQNYPKDVSGPSCLMCKKGIHLILNEVKKHYSQDQVIKELDKLCNFLKNPTKKSHCKSRINSVAPLIMNSAKVVVNPQSICFTLHLCLKPFLETYMNTINEKETTMNLEENTDDQNKQNKQILNDSSTVLNFKPELEYSFIDSVLKKMHATDAVDGPITLKDDQIKQKSEEPITVLNYFN